MNVLDRKRGWERFGRACAARVWIRLLAIVVMVGAAILLLRVSGGFPPTAWIFLIHVIPLVPRLWHLRSTGILLPLGAVTALSASLAMAWALLLRLGWTIAQSLRQGQRTPVSSSATVSMQVHQEQKAESSSQPLRARGDRQGSVASPQQESAIVATAVSPLPTSASYCSTPSFDVHRPSTAQQSSEEADSDLKVGSCIHLEKGQRWKEDALFASQGKLDGHAQTLSYGLFVVADGLGGHRLTGHEACELTIGSVTSCILASLSAAWHEQKLMDVVIEGLQVANQALFTCNQEHHAYMEVSMAICLVVNETVFAASVGGTRVYLCRYSTGLSAMTHAEEGTKAQGMGERTDLSLDSFTQSLQHGDMLLLCTDGLWKCVRDPEIEGVLSIPVSDPSQTSNALIQIALKGNEDDHIGVVVVQSHLPSAEVEMKAKDQTAGPGAHPFQ